MRKEKIRRKFNLLRIFIVIILLILLVNNFGSSSNFITPPKIIEPKIETEQIIKLTPVNVYQKIIEYKIEHPKIVFSQIMVETGHLNSDGAKIKNNLFGFINKKGHMSFGSWEESIEYYKEWQERKYISGNYYKFLKKVGYAEDSLYIGKLIKMEYLIFRNNKLNLEL